MEEEDQELLGAYLVNEALGHRDGETFFNKLNDHGYYTFFDMVSLTGEEIESMGCFLRADKILWDIFIEYIISQTMENNIDIQFLSHHGDHMKHLISREGFTNYRSQKITASTNRTGNVDVRRYTNETPTVFTPVPRNLSGDVTTRTSNQPIRNASIGTIQSPVTVKTNLTINPSTKKSRKVTDFPIFAGQKSDWKLFERKFIAIANSQNNGHVLELNPPYIYIKPSQSLGVTD